MFCDSHSRHVHVRLEFAQGAAFALEKKIEKKPTRRISQSFEHEVVVHNQPLYDTIWLPVKDTGSRLRRIRPTGEPAREPLVSGTPLCTSP